MLGRRGFRDAARPARAGAIHGGGALILGQALYRHYAVDWNETYLLVEGGLGAI